MMPHRSAWLASANFPVTRPPLLPPKKHASDANSLRLTIHQGDHRAQLSFNCVIGTNDQQVVNVAPSPSAICEVGEHAPVRLRLRQVQLFARKCVGGVDDPSSTRSLQPSSARTHVPDKIRVFARYWRFFDEDFFIDQSLVRGY